MAAADISALGRLGVRTSDAADDPRIPWRGASGVRAVPFRGGFGPAFRRGWIEPGETAMLQ